MNEKTSKKICATLKFDYFCGATWIVRCSVFELFIYSLKKIDVTFSGIYFMNNRKDFW